MSEFELIEKPPYIKSYREWDHDRHEFNFVVEVAVGDIGAYVAWDEQNLDILGMIFMLKTLADELGRQLESDG